MPVAVREQYELTKPLSGGPTYDFPAYGGMRIDFSKITLQEAAALHRRGWHGIRKVLPKPATRVAEAPAEIKQDPAPEKPRPPVTPKSV